MRKVILFALTFFIIASLCICTAFASENVVFLSSGGTGDGSSADTPIGTLDGAYNALGTDGGTIVFMDEYSISVKDDVPKHTGKIIWTSVYGDVDYRENGAAFKFTAQVRVGFGGPTEIDYLNINDAVGGVFAANFNDFTIGSNVTSSTAGKTVIIGGANIDTTVPALAAGESCTVTVNGGSYNYIVAFSRMVSNISHEGTVTLNIGSDVSVINCFLGANGTNAKGGTTVFNISDNASVTGTLYLSSTNNGVAKVSNGSVTVNAKGEASVAKIIGYAAQWFPNGTRTLNYEETVSFPTPYTTYFGAVNVIEPETPDEPELPDTPTSLEVVYVKDGASGTGASADSPIGTFASAYNLLSEEGGTIILVGDTTVSETLTLPEISGDVLVKSEGGAKLILDAEIILAKNTDEYTFTFDLPVTSNEKAILGGFNNVTFGENFAVIGALDFFGGALAVDSDTISDTEFITDLPYTVTVKGGTFRHFAGGNYRHVNTAMIGAVAAPLTVNIEGGTFTDSFNLSGDSFLSDDATLTISGGTFECSLFVRSVNLTNQARATKLSPTVTSDRDYYAMDGDIAIAISGGVFNGGLISAYDTDKVAYTQLLRGKFTVTVTGGTFADGTVFDATQVKAYHGQSDDLASITYPNSYDFTITRFDSINGASQEYDEPLRIAFIGDSITEGVGSSDPMTKSYPAVFASLASNRDIVVANYGVAGSAATPSSSVYYCNRLAWPIVTEETDADYIVIAIGTNDNAAGGVNSTRVAFENSYRNIITTLGSLDTTEKVFITNAIARGSSEVTTGQIRVASVVRPLQERIANEYAATDAKKYVFVDLYGLTLHSAAAGPLLGSDNLHPNATGYVAMAEAIYGAIFEGKTTPETDYRHGDVYLSASGNPYASGTAEDPTSSIAHAMALMPLDGNGTLHISGTITCPAYLSTSSLPANLTIVGEGEGATLEFVTYETFKLLSNVKFDNITLKTTVSDMSIICGYNSAEFTDSVVFEGNWSFVAGLYAAAADTAEIASSANDCTITINATAAFVNFILGNRRFAATAPFGTYSGNMTVFVGDNVTASGNAGAVGQNYLAGSVTVSTPATLNLAEYAAVGADPNSLYDASNNTGSITVTKREAPAALEVVYVKDGGNGNGASAATPCGSIAAAHALLPNGGTVVLVGETTISARTTLPIYKGVITYTNVYGGVDYRESGARLYFPSGITVILGGEAVFKDIAIHTDTYTYISAGFNPLTFDTGVVTTHTEENLAKDSDEVNGLRITGGYNTLTLGEVTDDRNANITLKSGFFRYVHGFSRYSGKTTYTGTATIVVEGTAVVDELITGATQNDATAANVNLTLSDDARIYNVFLGGQQKTNLLTGTFNFVVNGGDIYEIDALCLFTAVECNSILTYDVNTVPEGLVMLAEVAQFKTIQTFCERDNTHNYSEPFASEFDESVMLKKCSICNDIQFVSELPEGSGDNVVFVAEGGLGDGSHPAIPTNDLYKAFETLKTSGGTIVIINEYTLKINTDQKIGTAPSFFQEPLHTGAITVTSVYGGVDYREKGAKFVFDGNVDYKLSGPVTFDGIVFDATEETTKNTIAARYNPVIFGEDVVMLRDMDDAYSLDLIGGYNGFRYTDFTDVEIEDELIEMVNPARPLEINPETGDYTIDDPVFVEKEGVASTFFLRKDAAESINKMFADMYELGLKRPDWISYAWRGYYAQYDGYSKQVGNIRVNYPDYDFEKAHQTVLRSCSLPGSSEHHLGFAIDFHDTTVAETNPHFAYDKTAEWAWLMQNAYKYGFILRFTPKDTATTGFIYEAWHFRYVGVEHATAIANLNSNGDPIANADMLKTPEWCLEDYAGLVLGMYDLDSSVTVNGGTFAHIEGGSRDCGDIDFTGEESVVIGEGAKIMPEGTTYDLVYFSSGADGDGLSAASPIGKIEKAYALLGNDGGTLVWMGELAVGAATEFPEHTGVVTITSLYDGIDYREIGAALKYTAAIRVGFNGPTVVENFKIINAHGGDHLLCANFNELTLGEGMMLVDKNGATANTLTIVGGGNNNTSVGTLDAGETNTVTVMSGTYRQIVGFSAYNTNFSHEGTVNLNIGGDANFTSLIMGAKATGSKGGSTVLTLTDNAYIGTVYLANGDNTVALNGTATIYAKDNSEIGAFNHYRADLFPEGARSIYYDETASLPESLEKCFDNISVIGEELLSGDATGDGVVTLLDVIRALRVCTGMTDEYSRAADVNGDGEITIADAMAIIYIVLNN